MFLLDEQTKEMTQPYKQMNSNISIVFSFFYGLKAFLISVYNIYQCYSLDFGLRLILMTIIKQFAHLGEKKRKGASEEMQNI